MQSISTQTFTKKQSSHAWKKFKFYSRQFYYFISRNAQRSEQHYFLLGLLGFVGFPAYYFVWQYLYLQPYENLPLRLIGSLLCFFLMLKNYWPKKLKVMLPAYFFITLTFSIPFYFNFMLLKNDLSVVWLFSTFAGLFIMILILEWYWIFILYPIGALIAWAAYLLTGGNAGILVNYMGFMAIYFFTGLVGAMFMYNTERLQREKLEGMATLSSNIAHELRTPLLGLKSGIAGLRRYIPVLYEAYQLAKKQGLPVAPIRTAHFNNMLPALESMDRETHFANMIIDMLLMNIRGGYFQLDNLEVCDMANCIDTALAHYPFDAAEMEAKIHWGRSNNFQFMGSALLMEHIIFNLLKNALHFIVKAEKGEIYIWMENFEDCNELHFKDTGSGIPAEIMPKLFERFFTTTLTGTGIGLSFCSMIMKKFDGSIICNAIEGEFTEFILTFPKISSIRE